MLRVDHTASVRSTVQQVATELSIIVVVSNGLTTMRHRVDGRGDVAATLDQHHGAATPTEGSAGDAAELRRVSLGGGLHINMVGTTEAFDPQR